MPWPFTDIREVFILFYFSIYWKGLAGRLDLIGGPDLARGPPSEQPWSKECYEHTGTKRVLFFSFYLVKCQGTQLGSFP